MRLFLITAFFLVFSLNGFSQSDTSLFPQPLKMDFSAATKACGFCLVENIYPIGWSKDGKFAYAAEPPDEACGCYYFELFIRDLAHDSISWHFFYTSDMTSLQLEPDGKHKVYTSLDQIWTGEAEYFSKHLHQNGIIPVKDMALLAFEDSSISIKQTWMPANRSEFGYKYIDSLTISTVKDTIRSSTSESTGLPPIAVNISGCIKSPFEDRRAVWLAYKTNGWEGVPYVLIFRPAGLQVAGR